MERNIDRAMQRTRAYWYEDGLTEVAVGGISIVIALLFFAEVVIPPGSFNAGLSAIGLPIVVIAGGWLASRAVRAAKARITYPRTGYVAYRRLAGWRRGAAVIAGAAMAALLAVLVATMPATKALIPGLQGLVVGAFWLYMGHTLGIVRFYALAVFSALAGVLAALSGLGDIAGDAAYFAAMGVALVASGALTLQHYLSTTRPPAGGVRR